MLATIGLLSGCEPSVPPLKVVTPTPQAVDTTKQVVDTIKEEIFYFSLLDSMDVINVNCNNFIASFPIKQLDEVVLRVTPEKELSYLRVNNKVFYEKRLNNYRYNTKGDVIVSQGNTAMVICRDHDISIEDFKRWNPGVDIEKLKLNQLVHVSNIQEN